MSTDRSNRKGTRCCAQPLKLGASDRSHPPGKKVNKGKGWTEGVRQTRRCSAIRRCASSAACSRLCLSDLMFGPPIPKSRMTPCVCLALGVKRYSEFSLVSGHVWMSYQAAMIWQLLKVLECTTCPLTQGRQRLFKLKKKQRVEFFFSVHELPSKLLFLYLKQT